MNDGDSKLLKLAGNVEHVVNSSPRSALGRGGVFWFSMYSLHSLVQNVREKNAIGGVWEEEESLPQSVSVDV